MNIDETVSRKSVAEISDGPARAAEAIGPFSKEGHLSRKNLLELNAAHGASFAGQRASRAVGDLRWVPAQSYAIQRDETRDAWFAGHVSALLSDGHFIIAGAQTGGVWLLTPSVQPSFRDGHDAVPLSDAWETPSVTSLAYSPGDTNQIFVGCEGTSSLFLIELQPVLGGKIFKQSLSLPLPPDAGTRPFAIVTFASPRRIVVANDRGVWWSPIPQPATKLSGYDWQAAQGLPVATAYSGLAAGSGASVVASVWAMPPDATNPPPVSGIYRGTWSSNTLTFTKSMIAGVDPDMMRRTSLASCEDQRNRMYLVAAASDDTLLTVLSSVDGGLNWRARPSPDKAKAGFQGFYNNCITVSPQQPDLVVIGWLSGGPFWSLDGSQTWLHPHHQESNSHLHNDLHAVLLGRNPSGPEPLYVGGDGGIAVTLDRGATYHSQFSRPLHNLQFYAHCLTASSRFPGLLSVGTQDNGNIYCYPDTDAGTSWRTLEGGGGDGGINRFIDPLGVLLRYDNTGVNVRMATWNDTTKRFPVGAGEVIAADDSAAGVPPTAIEVVRTPAFKRNGQLMYAVIGAMGSGALYGFFADSDAANPKLIRLGTMGALIRAIASIDGSTLLIGTENGRVISFNTSSGVATEQTLPSDASGVVARLEAINASQAYALIGRQILRLDGTAWTATAGLSWETFAVDLVSGRLFAATQSDVFISSNHGKTWSDASIGLPARPNCNDLRVAADGAGGRNLYLGTYGRSAWRATIALPPVENDFEVPALAVDILLGIIQDGGGVFRIGKRLVKVGPRPVIRDILAALATEDFAQSMPQGSTRSARAIRRTALEQIAQIAHRELDQLG